MLYTLSFTLLWLLHGCKVCPFTARSTWWKIKSGAAGASETSPLLVKFITRYTHEQMLRVEAWSSVARSQWVMTADDRLTENSNSNSDKECNSGWRLQQLLISAWTHRLLRETEGSRTSPQSHDQVWPRISTKESRGLRLDQAPFEEKLTGSELSVWPER